MKTNFTRLFILCFTAAVLISPCAQAQRQLGKKKGPTSKLYIAEAQGDTQIRTGDKVYSARQASAFDAPGTVIETKENSRTTFVYSNGVGMTVGQNSRVEINRFEQAPFTADRAASADATAEPSNSQSDIYLARGTVGISTSQLASGSVMLCSTPLASINVRGGNISIQTTDDETIISLLDGAATVFSGDKDGGGTVLQPGERIIIRRAPAGKPPVAIVTSIPLEARPGLSDLVTAASDARRTVSFEVIEQKAAQGLDAPANAIAAGTAGSPGPAGANSTAAGADTTQEIVVKPAVPANLPTNIVISADRLPGG